MSNITLPHAVFLYDTSGSEKGTNTNPVVVSNYGTLLTGSSTTTPVAGGAEFTGSIEDVSKYSSLSIIISSTQFITRAYSKLYVFCSNDGTTFTSLDRGEPSSAYDNGGGFTHFSNTSQEFKFKISCKYIKISYKQSSGSTPSAFSLQTFVKSFSDDTEISSVKIDSFRKSEPYKPSLAVSINENSGLKPATPIIAKTGLTNVSANTTAAKFPTISGLGTGLTNAKLLEGKLVKLSGYTVPFSIRTYNPETDLCEIEDLDGGYPTVNSATDLAYELYDRPGYPMMGITEEISSTKAAGEFHHVSLTRDLYLRTASKITDGHNFAGVDPFGRLRVGNPYTLADLNFAYEVDNRDWAPITASGGSVSYITSSHVARVATTTTSGSSAVLQTQVWYRYQSGKAHWLRMTCAQSNTGNSNQTRRWGLFDDNNGVYFANINSTNYVGVRSLAGGTVTNNLIAQSSWNIDKLDGTGPSKNVLDISKGNIYEIEFQWLGVGEVIYRINGDIVHIQRHAGTLVIPYMQSAILPIKYEILNTNTATAGYIDAICCSLESLGGTDEPRETFAASNTSDISVSTTQVPLLAIRNKSTYNGFVNRILAFPTLLGVSNTTANANIFYRVYLGSTITGGSWVSADARSSVEYNISGTAVSGGTLLTAATAIGTQAFQIADFHKLFDHRARHLRNDATGLIPDVLVITAVRLSNTGTCRAYLTWQEHSR